MGSNNSQPPPMSRIQATTVYWYKLSRPETEEHALALLKASYCVAVFIPIQGFVLGSSYGQVSLIGYAGIGLGMLFWTLYMAYTVAARGSFKSGAILLGLSATQVFGFGTRVLVGVTFPVWLYALALYNLFLAIQMMRGVTSFERPTE